MGQTLRRSVFSLSFLILDKLSNLHFNWHEVRFMQLHQGNNIVTNSQWPFLTIGYTEQRAGAAQLAKGVSRGV